MKQAFSKKNIWDKTPSVLKNTIGRGLGVFPQNILLGKKFRENCRNFKQMEWWPAKRIRQFQFNKLKEILTLAYDKSEFYHRLFDEVGFHPSDFKSLEQMNLLPTIDRQVVIENLSEMCTGDIRKMDADFCSTGGSSGTPLHFYINANRSSIEYACLTTSWGRIGFKTGMPMAVLRGRVVKPDKNGLYHEYDPILRHHYYSSFHLSEENMARYIEHICEIGPCFMHVYPSSITTLARFILRSGRKAPDNIKGIIAESEIIYPEQRQMVEDVFKCRLFSCYGQSEKLVLAAGCEKTNDYHIWPTYGYFELLDEKDNPVNTTGQRGEIVGTGFINTVMPFIRYRTGDLATYVSDHCEECGREHVIIRDIRGHRTQEVLITADGSEISWTALNMHDETFIHVRRFQFMQEKPGQAVLRIVPAQGFDEKDKARILKSLGAKFDGQLAFKITLVEEIALSSRGKAIYVEQRISRDLKG